MSDDKVVDMEDAKSENSGEVDGVKPVIELDEQPAECRKMTVRDSSWDSEAEEVIADCRIEFDANFDLDPSSPQGYPKLPVTRKVADSLVEQCARIRDGHNDTKMRVKRSFPIATYAIWSPRIDELGDPLPTFRGEVSLAPKIVVVEDEIYMRFKVDAEVPVADLGRLGEFVGRDDLRLTVSDLQQDLFGDDQATG